MVVFQFLRPIDPSGWIRRPEFVEQVFALVLREAHISTSEALMEEVVRLSCVESLLLLLPADARLRRDWHRRVHTLLLLALPTFLKSTPRRDTEERAICKGLECPVLTWFSTANGMYRS